MRFQPPFDRISVETGKLGGQPCIRAMRITVRRVLELLATYETRAELLAEYPYLEEEDLNQARLYLAHNRQTRSISWGIQATCI